jgi:malate dehydrogenase (oxaloacetate-decarboxylating)(NADP+)
VVDEGLAKPILVGRRDIIAKRIETLGLRLKLDTNCQVVNILSDPRYHDLVAEYYRLGRRHGVTEAIAKEAMRSRPSLISAMLLRRGDADAMLCGVVGTFDEHLGYVRDVIGQRPGVLTLAAMNMLMLPGRQIFICDTYVNHRPKPADIAEMALLAADEVRRFGLKPVVALLSHSSFGSSNAADAQVMRDAREILIEHDPGLVVEGEMRGDAALSKPVLDDVFAGSRLPADANLLIMPNVDAANISYNLLKIAAGNGITVGPILLGAASPVHILEPAVSVRRIVNMTALAVVDANKQRA